MGLLGISKKGKWIIGGVCAFAIVATATTGLAAWVIGQQTSGTGTGNITVATVTNQSIEIVDGSVAVEAVNFGPTAAGGEVIGSDNTDVEHLDVKLTGKVKTVVAGTSFKITAVTTATVDNPLVESYTESKETALVKLPQNVEIQSTSMTDVEGEENTKSFETTLSFEWGTALDGDNPCDHFKTTTVYKNKTAGYESAKACLEDLNTLKGTGVFTVTVTPSVTTVA